MKPIERRAAVAGMFYERDATDLRLRVDGLLVDAITEPHFQNIGALIVPHAGYVYSGSVAAAGYAQLPGDGQWDRIFIIGSSHHAFFDGASVDEADVYTTPLGQVPVDTQTVEALRQASPLISFHAKAHEQEHTIEVQLPFLQQQLQKPFVIVPIIMGTQNAETCAQIAQVLAPWFTPQNLFIISTDFSHYPSYNDAVSVDRLTAQAIVKNNPSALLNQLKLNDATHVHGLETSLCGWTSVLTLLNITSGLPVDYHLVKYLNSGDLPMSDPSRVVGYHAIAVCYQHNEEALSFTTDEKQQLVQRARAAFQAAVTHSSMPERPQMPAFDVKAGAFVTLYKKGDLRGCIGQFPGSKPLWKVIDEAAHSAALSDHRFLPVEADEIPDISVELSIITPLRKIQSEREIVMGKHGIYIRKGERSGTFLPQVAEHTGWSLDEFLGHCARDKAGIGWNGWRDADLFVYEALVIHETNDQS